MHYFKEDLQKNTMNFLATDVCYHTGNICKPKEEL